jgi:hypothetical protein
MTVDYRLDANWTLEKLGSLILEMEHGTQAEVVNDETTVILEKENPVSYARGGPTGLIALKVINHAAPFKPHCAETILQAARGIAKDSWADHIDYPKGGRWFRGIYFYPKENE